MAQASSPHGAAIFGTVARAYLGAYYSPEVLRTDAGSRTGQLTITPAAMSAAEKSPLAIQMQAAFGLDTAADGGSQSQPSSTVSPVTVGRECGVTGPPALTARAQSRRWSRGCCGATPCATA